MPARPGDPRQAEGANRGTRGGDGAAKSRSSAARGNGRSRHSEERTVATTFKTYDKLALLKLMYLAREGDRREGVLLRQGKGWFQVSGMGHEPLAVIATLLEPDDYLFTYYRSRGMVLARGMTNRELAEAYFAKRSSSSGGRQMPGHPSDRARNIWSVPTPTGACLLPACGAAWGMQLEGRPGVVVGTVGDAASRQGEFFEAIAFAVERQLPIVLVVEDNRYGISTNTDKFNPLKLGLLGEGIEVVHVDARHPDRVFDAAMPAVEKARSGDGPTVLHCEVDRLCSHTSSDDHRVYRPEEEICEMNARDPIDVVSRELIESGEMTDDEWEEIKREIDEQVDREYRQALAAADPSPDELLDELFGPLPKAEVPPLEGGKKWRIVDAVNRVFREGLEQDERYVFFGEDIEDPKGGVFGLTSGLSSRFPERVFNSPLAEATIAGVACGLAGYGMRPVFEIQFVDFVAPGWNQISQNLATLRWRTAGDWKCPVVLYMPYGAYLPGGSIWHSQANEALFAHVPGLRVVVPTTPEDAAGLMWTAMHAEDPTIFLVPKHRFRQQFDVPANLEPVPFGKARIHREGNDVTLVTWGNCIEQAFEAAKELEGEVSIEVIDLRTIVPWDRETIAASLEKTGRLVVVQEDARSCSVGQMLVSELTGDPETWGSFLSPPQLVSRPDVHIGFNPIYEFAALPDTASVVEAVRLVME
ncbi:MAG: thiamine pyrophosphate-dependent enzyme [Planctomycetales bacterium]